jgi:UDP-N-acetylmuramate--alanine ligase
MNTERRAAQNTLTRRKALLGALARPAGETPLRVFCSGVGGTGLSGLARLAAALGHQVSGSDRALSAKTASLEAIGVQVFPGQTAANLTQDTDLFVATAALPFDHPELVAAIELGIPVVKYAEALASFVSARRGVAIAGTHGKTTTTALTAHVLESCGRDPSYIVGGEPHDLPANAALGPGTELVFEACEFDRSFRHYQPALAVILNVEEDHFDCYGGLDEIVDAFVEFGVGLQDGGTLIVNADWPQAMRVADMVRDARPDVNVETIAQATEGRFTARDIETPEGFPRFMLHIEGKPVTRVQLGVPGRHNVGNALAAISVAHRLGVDPEDAARAVASFRGVRRRFDMLRARGDVLVVDDYAHHPTALQAVIRATRERFPTRRVVALFEPHQANRTHHMFEEFAQALAEADRVVVGDIFVCRDDPEDLQRVSSEDLARAVRKLAPATEACTGGGPDQMVAIAGRILQAGDVALFLGAGRISGVAHRVAQALPAPVPSGPQPRTRERTGSGRLRRCVRPLREALRRDLGDRLQLHESLGPHCTYKAGGRARFFSAPTSEEEAIFVMRAFQRRGVPILPLGGGSNVLFTSDLFNGAVISTRHLRSMRALGTTVRASAGAGLPGVIRLAERQSLGGLAGFAGIPGTLGGAVFGNAGGPPGSSTVADLVRRVRLLEPDGRVRWYGPERLGLSYRASALEGALVLAVDLALEPGDRDELRGVRLATQERKAAAQPLEARSAGCVFRNPDGDSAGRLIDRLGLKGQRIGGACVSEHHGNFIVNEGGARPGEILRLMERVRDRVRAATGIELHTEVRLIA